MCELLREVHCGLLPFAVLNIQIMLFHTRRTIAQPTARDDADAAASSERSERRGREREREVRVCVGNENGAELLRVYQRDARHYV